ncbi:MAG: hypothetical protein E4H36_01205 [Spirochaetales bacterium]|nr:MAG: hypothetical protein E4H36_01205 [Spirochaetales bacterium]
MNTTPTTSEKWSTSYTVVGGKTLGSKGCMPGELSVVVLGRSGKIFRRELLVALDKAGVSDIISMEGTSASYDVEQMSITFPRVRFLILHKEVSTGEQVNIGISEARGDNVLVLKDDMRITTTLISSRLMEKIITAGSLCTVPVLLNQKIESIPSIQAPAFFRKNLKVMQLLPRTDGIESLFPFDYAGIYNREKFLGIYGYDGTLLNPYWQKMDFGFRAHMWGERITCLTSFKLTYLGDIPAEDATPDESYKFFFLKNLSIRFTGDSGVLPSARFLSFMFKAGAGFLRALRDFNMVRKWVEANAFRFQSDARSVTELWEIPHHEG